jgi:hypothetical protein
VNRLANTRSLFDDEQPNKGMKQTSAEHIGRSQLIPGVVRTAARSTRACLTRVLP